MSSRGVNDQMVSKKKDGLAILFLISGFDQNASLNVIPYVFGFPKWVAPKS
jgi:hypothetical protein